MLLFVELKEKFQTPLKYWNLEFIKLEFLDNSYFVSSSFLSAG